MKLWIIFLFLNNGLMKAASSAGVTPTTPSEALKPTEDGSTMLVNWLTKYGYLPPSDPSTGQLQAWTAVTRALRTMQKFAGLKDTGVLDEETAALMRTPRCSLPDDEEELLVHEEGKDARRRRRSAVSMWTRRNINWRVQSYPSSSHLSREMVRSLVFYALRVWADPTPLEFHEVGTFVCCCGIGSSRTQAVVSLQVGSPESADLQVDFLHGYHGDNYPFDGAGGAVGHAFFPSDPARAGGVHLDSEEQWAFRQPDSEGTDLFTVLVHEFGHALGLTHSSSRHSVMRPYYQGPAGDPLHYRLGHQDLEYITQLYGRRNQLLASDAPRLTADTQLRHRSHHHHPHRHGPSMDRCNTSFDAVAKIRGETFFFKGLTMWRVNSGGLVSRRGSSVRKLWRGLPADLPQLEAVIERPSDHAIIFISGSQFWLFRDLSLQEGYPQPLPSLRMARGDGEDEEEHGPQRWGLQWDAEEGSVWGKLGVREKREDVWSQLIQEGVSGITTDNDGSIYIFKGDSYWKFLFPGSAPLQGYPRSSAADWLDCADALPLPSVGDISLSSPPGRQELRERRRDEEKEEDGVRRRDRHEHKPKYRQDSAPYSWTQCTCQSGALSHGGRTLTCVYILITWILLTL
ncbi:matrix metalloproteinase-17b [Oryzias melastigma]|uniref:matrix metalloproteinase-17b n=1 Tax=Oryzias melastigma TaxID=30732 RepID=UPI00168D5E30|nr:matrix metalloproteinase-17b [Oryzias melastigma]